MEVQEYRQWLREALAVLWPTSIEFPIGEDDRFFEGFGYELEQAFNALLQSYVHLKDIANCVKEAKATLIRAREGREEPHIQEWLERILFDIIRKVRLHFEDIGVATNRLKAVK